MGRRSRSQEKRKFGRYGRFGGKKHYQESRFQWHNYDREISPEANKKEREREAPPSQGMFRIAKADGSSYEIRKELVKYTLSLPKIAYSTNHQVKSSLAKKEPDAQQTPQKLLDQLKEQKRCEVKSSSTPNPNKCLSPPAIDKNLSSTKHQFTPREKPPIVIKISTPPQQPPDEKLNSPKAKPEKKKETLFDIFGVDEPPKPDKTVPPKLSICVPALQSLYDEEDEEDFMPTNALRIGSNQIKPIKVNQLVKEKKEPKPEPAKVTIAIVPPPQPTPIALPVETTVEPKPPPSSKISEALQPLDILKTLDTQSTEVDDFLQQIQEQRQRIEEKLSNSPKKAPKFSLCIIDIDTVQKEINEKLEQMPDDFPDLPLPGTNENEAHNASVAESSTETEASSSDSSSESDSNTESSESSSSESSSSSGSSTSDEDDSEASTSSEDNEENTSLQGTKKTVTSLGIDLTLASRSPVMLKIQSKPRVIPIFQALAEEEEPGIERPNIDLKEARPRSESRKDAHRHEKNDRRERTSSDRRGKRDRSDYGRESSRKQSSRHDRSGRREPDLRNRDNHTAVSRKKDRHRSKSRDRKTWRRSRSTSHSPSPISNRPRLQDVRNHDSRSRSLSLDRAEGHGRKRSPWRPPIDFWENLNVPTTSWAYNDEQYFSRAYYDESYNYFEQNQHCNAYPNANQEWPHQELPNGGGTSPMRGSLDDRINNVLNGGPAGAPQHPQHLQQQQGVSGTYAGCYDGSTGYADYNRAEPSYYVDNNNQYENRPGSDQYRQTANLRSISCNQGYANNTPRRPPQQSQANHANHVNHVVAPTTPLNISSSPFALQKGNVIELVPSVIDPNNSSSGYQSEENPRGERRAAVSKSAQRKAIREKKRMEKNMRKKKLEMELQSLLDGSPGIEDMIMEGEKAPLTPTRNEVRKVIFSDGVLPGDGTSDSALDTSDDSNVDLTELTSNQLKKYRKKKRKKRTTVKANVAKMQQQEPPVEVPKQDEPVTENCSGTDAIGLEDIAEELSVPLPPPNDPPSQLVQPALKREVMERPKKLLYFNSVHRERRMDFFSIFVPFSMFIRLNDPRLLLGHPAIVNRKRIPQPIYPPNMYPPPPQPFQHLPPVQISAITSSPMVHPGAVTPGNDQMPMSVPQSTGPIRHIPTIGDN